LENRLRHHAGVGVLVAALGLLVPTLARPQEPAAAPPLVCESKEGEREVCPGDTSAGVALMKSTGAAACLLGKTWGYHDAGVWVADGCSGEFQLGRIAVGSAAAPAPPAPAQPSPKKPYVPVETWGEFDPGKGFLVGKSALGQLSISGYALVRWMDQNPADETFTDHLGNVRPVDTRNDIYSHRIMVFFTGWLGSPKLVYSIVLSTSSAGSSASRRGRATARG
jgi:hypothetical protein